jgi:L-histidine N-alpha-methyltransferase
MEAAEYSDLVAENPATNEFLADVVNGLTMRPRQIPPRWFYDHRGSELFEAITDLPEYYPTRTERAILDAHADDIGQMAGPGRAVVEFGSGSSSKTPLLLSAVRPSAYVPIDISGAFLRESAAATAQRFPSLPIYPLEADFTRPVRLPASTKDNLRLGFFPGSTIGNLVIPDAVDLLRAMASTLGPKAMLVVGIDLVKKAELLVPAYADEQGVTAEFNLNLLRRINRELDASIPVKSFEHVALWNGQESRIEMHLRARQDVRFAVAGRAFTILEGETIHTENSYKYGRADFGVLLRAGGWRPIADWTDDREFFAVIVAEAI